MEFHVHWCFVGEERQMLSAVHDDQKRPAADQTMQMDIIKYVCILSTAMDLGWLPAGDQDAGLALFRKDSLLRATLDL